MDLFRVNIVSSAGHRWYEKRIYIYCPDGESYIFSHADAKFFIKNGFEFYGYSWFSNQHIQVYDASHPKTSPGVSCFLYEANREMLNKILKYFKSDLIF